MVSRVGVSLIVSLILIDGSIVAQTPKNLPPLNAAVLEYAKSHVGEKVGNGECTTLALEALKEAGGKRFRMKRDGDYVWGEPVESFKDALPGDIVQFRNAVFEGSRLRANTGATSTWYYEFPHHTAIIAKVQDHGAKVTFLHQNTGKAGASEEAKRKVKQETLPVGSLSPGGKIWIYRPIPVDGDNPDDPDFRFDPPPKFKFERANPG